MRRAASTKLLPAFASLLFLQCARLYPDGDAAGPDRQLDRDRSTCEPVLRALVHGAFYAAVGDTAPRAKLLLQRDCAEPHPSSPALCERLRTHAPREGFRLVRHGDAFDWEYVGYENGAKGPEIVVVYSRFRVDTEWAPCELYPPGGGAPIGKDTGDAKWSNDSRSIFRVYLYPGGSRNPPLTDDGEKVGLLLPYQDGYSDGPVFVRLPPIGN